MHYYYYYYKLRSVVVDEILYIRVFWVSLNVLAILLGRPGFPSEKVARNEKPGFGIDTFRVSPTHTPHSVLSSVCLGFVHICI